MTEQKADGKNLFADVFHRADKNDDGHLTLEEFINYFGDGVLSKKEIVELFESIDKDGNKNIEVEELLAYFLKGFEPYQPLFSALEQMHSAINRALAHSAETYSSLSYLEQFKSRFYLREFTSQLLSVEKPIEDALNTLERDALANKEISERAADQESFYVELAPQLHHLSGSSAASDLRTQVDRLATLISRLERCKIELHVPDEELIDDSPSSKHVEAGAHVAVNHEFQPIAEKAEEFHQALRKYAREVRRSPSCMHLYIRHHTDTPGGLYYLYEVWQSDLALERHRESDTYLQFAKAKETLLAHPPTSELMHLPASWFPHRA